ncbi:MAG: NAD(P)/FAD-dependent oxidoreductase [Clostridia bacterium]|nr:NAD(P)/FAD-dependent oxidoreductase [Clostridia bacterium]
MNNGKSVAVIGGGAAGMMACCRLTDAGIRPVLFERNSLLGKKLGITGKGRCNVTNDCMAEEYMKNLTKNSKFMYSAINRFSPHDTIKFFTSLGVPLKTERGRRVFPVSDKATDVVLALKNKLVAGGCKIINERVTGLESENGKITTIKTEKTAHSGFDAIILCTGGLSYPVTGSTGDGYEIAKALGHTVTPLIPSLSALECNGGFCEKLQGLSLKNISVKIKDNIKNKIIFEDFGEMLFTHFGVSGPVILSASAHMRPMENGRYSIIIDEKPALTHDMLDKRVLFDFDKYKNRQISNAMGDLLPQKMILPFIDLCSIPYSTSVNSITKAQRKVIVDTMKAIELNVSRFRPIDEAIVTSGGINVKEIEPATMRSKLCENLYFAGEIIDVDAYTGGYNLQIAFSTAVTAADAIINIFTEV